MTEIPAQTVNELRRKTGAPMMECKKALTSSCGDFEKAIKILKEAGLNKAREKSSRTAGDGLVVSYIHGGGKIGVLVEVNCETDFVARTDEFRHLVENIAMQVAAACPKYVNESDVPECVLKEEKEIFEKQAKASGKPEKALEGIVTGKLKKFLSDICLMSQPYIKDDGKTIKQLLDETVGKLGENIIIKRFARFQLGEEK